MCSLVSALYQSIEDCKETKFALMLFEIERIFCFSGRGEHAQSIALFLKEKAG